MFLVIKSVILVIIYVCQLTDFPCDFAPKGFYDPDTIPQHEILLFFESCFQPRDAKGHKKRI